MDEKILRGMKTESRFEGINKVWEFCHVCRLARDSRTTGLGPGWPPRSGIPKRVVYPTRADNIRSSELLVASLEDIRGFKGVRKFDADGQRLGFVDLVELVDLVDPSARPFWRSRSLVPATGGSRTHSLTTNLGELPLGATLLLVSPRP